MNNYNEILPDLKLRFNIDYPDLEECFNEGFDCAIEEMEEENNPYPVNSIEHEHWLEGWWAANYGEERKVIIDEDHTMAAANEGLYHFAQEYFIKFLELTGAIAATAFVGYQLLDLVA